MRVEKFQSNWGHIDLETYMEELSSSLAGTTPAQKMRWILDLHPKSSFVGSKGHFSVMNLKIKGKKKKSLTGVQHLVRVLLLWVCSRSYFCLTTAVTSHVKKLSSSFPKCIVGFFFLCCRH